MCGVWLWRLIGDRRIGRYTEQEVKKVKRRKG